MHILDNKMSFRRYLYVSAPIIADVILLEHTEKKYTQTHTHKEIERETQTI